MDNERLAEILDTETEKVTGETGFWEVEYRNHMLLVVTDPENNRMRIFTPVIEERQVEKDILIAMLEANFHSALDAKYSIYEGFVISVFTHPLKELSSFQFIDALQQVVNLANNFGTTFSSTDLIFGSGGDDADAEKRINKSPSKKKRT
ncbi:MAG: hypothetical protein DHS20C18_00580 [Saprospiraceae bacterium]|nr:MAG: hypothetical protein DHS20C18_00580 [Saprospiraceae bacterium]